MVQTRAQWDARMRRLPVEDRTTYEQYLESINAPTSTTTPTPTATTTPSVTPTPTPSSVTKNPWDEPPSEAPEGFSWKWVGARSVGRAGSGSWRLLRVAGSKTAGGETTGGGTTGGGSITTGGSAVVDTSAADRLKAEQAAKAAAEEKRRQGQSAYSLLFSEFDRYGLGALVAPLQDFIVEGLSPAEFTLRLRDTDAYKKRFAANEQRIRSGLRSLSEAEYIQLEDQYQNVMRNYGLPASYYQRGDMGIQQGFEKFIAGDVSAAELEDRIQTAQNRVINAAPEVSKALREFYPDITSGDILAYALDPSQALTNIWFTSVSC